MCRRVKKKLSLEESQKTSATYVEDDRMNMDLEERLRDAGVTTVRLAKSEKVKILARWTREFPELLGSARQRRGSAKVARDHEGECGSRPEGG